MTKIFSASLVLTALTALSTAALAPAPAAALPKMCVIKTGINGHWRGDDGGDYYVREDLGKVYWVGMSGDGGKSWMNVFTGTRTDSHTLYGTWRDVRGNDNSGTLKVNVNGRVMTRTFSANNYFSGKRWTKSC